MYNIIKNPETNRNVSIYSKKGIAILEKYLNNLTGGMRKMTPEDDPMDFKGSLNYDNIPPMFRNKYINKEGKEIKYKGYKNKLKNILEIIKKKSVQDQEKITEITHYYDNDNIMIEYPIQNCPLCRGVAFSKKIVIVKSVTTQQYLYKNMVLFLFTPNPCFSKYSKYNIMSGKDQLITKLYKDTDRDLDQTIDILNGKMYDLFLKHIKIIKLKNNNSWTHEVKNLIYRFHLTNIISVLLILTKNLFDLRSDKLYKSLLEKVMENIKDIENFSEEKELINIKDIENFSEEKELIKYSEKNVDFLISINEKLSKLLLDIFKLPDETKKHEILQGKSKRNLLNMMRSYHAF